MSNLYTNCWLNFQKYTNKQTSSSEHREENWLQSRYPLLNTLAENANLH